MKVVLTYAFIAFALILAIVLTPGCGRPVTADDLDQGATVAYVTADRALELADTAGTAWLDSLAVPSERELETARTLGVALRSADYALDRARAGILTGREIRAELEAALPWLLEALAILREVTDVPPEIVALVEQLRAALE